MIPPEIESRVREWIDGPFDSSTKTEIHTLIQSNPQGLFDAFYKDLSFGTGGMRGLMGAGTNRMNVYTIRRATQGLASYIKKTGEMGRSGVFIGYDVRHHSKEFALEAARVLAGNGIQVYITKEICPTPLVSFGCRKFHCQAAIMITASHNPPAYNGYKVYWSDGAQVVFPHDEGIMEEVALSRKDIPLCSPDSPLIRWIGEELDDAYLEKLESLRLHPELSGTSLKIVYTPLHGTGIRIIPRALASWGFTSVSLVDKQSYPDANFTHAPVPNPEDAKALKLGEERLEAENGDLLIATDPDADRVGIAIRGKIRFTGNQIACILLHHIASSLEQKKELPSNAAFVKTIVTTELFKKIAETYGGTCIDVLTGFKYIGEKIAAWEESFGGYQYIFGAEESYGYLFGTFVRDKDSVSTSCLLAEAALLAKKQNLTLQDRLYQLYQKYGVHRESLTNLNFADGASGMEQMSSLMHTLRTKVPSSISGQKIVKYEDYLSPSNTDLPKSDVLRFWLEDGSKLVIRPSGTEPKVKIYAEVIGAWAEDIDKQILHLDKKLVQLVAAFQQEAQS